MKLVKSYLVAAAAAVFALGSAHMAANPTMDAQARGHGFEELGGYDGIHKIAVAVLKAGIADSQTGPFFKGWEAGSENFNNLADCLTIQLSIVTGSKDYTYPTKLKNGHECQEMIPAHEGIGADNLQIGQSDFKRFVSIAANTARDMGVNLSILAVLGEYLYGLEGEIVYHKAD